MRYLSSVDFKISLTLTCASQILRFLNIVNWRVGKGFRVRSFLLGNGIVDFQNGLQMYAITDRVNTHSYQMPSLVDYCGYYCLSGLWFCCIHALPCCAGACDHGGETGFWFRDGKRFPGSPGLFSLQIFFQSDFG